MDVHLLGPIEARLDGRPIALGARKQRAVLAMLALQVGRTVSADRLAEGLWGEQPPLSAPKMVQLYVSHLRRLLAGNGAEIVTRGRGYEPRLTDGEVDAVQFVRLLDQTRAREALALWCGEPLADVADEPFAAAEIRRLEELRERAAELAIEADLAAGRHGEVIGELEALVAEHPLRERLHAERMLALYRSGRQAEALEAYREARAIVRRRPFDDVRVRRALNYATDRARVVELTGGRELAGPNCQVLPNGFPGYEPHCPYSADPAPGRGWTAPDLERARRLVAESGRAGEDVVVRVPTFRRDVGRYFVVLLGDLGFRASLGAFATDYAARPAARPYFGA